MITEVSDVLYHFKDDQFDFKVHCFDDHIFIFGEDYQQMFENSGRVGVKAFYRIYPTMEKVQAAAQMYTEGKTNRDTFLKEVIRLASEGKISEADARRLTLFITQIPPGTPPDTIRKQLILCGYESIAELMHFTDPHPEFNKTCEGFYRFVCESKDFLRNEK